VRTAARALPAAAPATIAGPLARAGRWDPARYRAEIERFHTIYDPIPILPPAENRTLVVQLTSGCSWNRCTFCHLYRDATFTLKTPERLRSHVEAVLALVGRALPLRRGIFLGQANALCVAQEKLLSLIDIVREELARVGAPPEFDRLAAFVDAFSAPKTADDYRELRERGLESVALGLESGNADVLAALGKPAESEQAIALAAATRAADVRIGIIVLVGAGGAQLARAHVADTVRTIVAMQPTRRDRIYLSPLVIHADSVYEERGAGADRLDAAGLAAQAAEIRDGLRAAGVAAPIALYDIRRFIY
jgi:radical SAM superfamily enzyme YgiQ (UPF0313 family)